MPQTAHCHDLLVIKHDSFIVSYLRFVKSHFCMLSVGNRY